MTASVVGRPEARRPVNPNRREAAPRNSSRRLVNGPLTILLDRSRPVGSPGFCVPNAAPERQGEGDLGQHRSAPRERERYRGGCGRSVDDRYRRVPSGGVYWPAGGDQGVRRVAVEGVPTAVNAAPAQPVAPPGGVVDPLAFLSNRGCY